MSKYQKLTEGDVIELNAKENTLNFACCDCGLVHRIAFGIHGQDLGIAMERNDRATAQLRRHWFGDLHHPGSKSKFKIVRIIRKSGS